MRILTTSLIAVAMAATPVMLAAQDGFWDWTLTGVSIRVDVGRRVPARVPEVVYAPVPMYDRVVYEPVTRRAKAKGPAFCRSGSGHPVHGRRWCVDKGFGLGGAPAYQRIRWERRGWERAIPVYRPAYGYGPIAGRELAAVIGPTVYARLDRERVRLGSGFALSGRWIRPDGNSLVLQVRSGPFAVAELTDFGGDGRMDVVLVASR